MRVLAGHINQILEVRQGRSLPGRAAANDSVLAFGNGYSQIPHQPGVPWNALMAGCPPGWKPDVYLHWSPEYNAVPEGIEEADCLTVGVLGDWNLGMQAVGALDGAFDLLFADRAGCAALRRAGFSNVLQGLLWAYQPELHRVLEGVERDIDVLLVGSFNHGVHQDRARWLARVARLSQRFRVVLASGVFDEAYVNLLNRARIVFNRSVGGGINMRVYEAVACGALLFNEAEGSELPALLTDREHCVLYAEENLEELVDHYLAPENQEECRRIVRAAQERLGVHTYAHHFAGLLDTLEPYVREHQRRTQDGADSRRAFAALPEAERRLRRATQWVLTRSVRLYPRLIRDLSARDGPDHAALIAVTYAEWGAALPVSPERDARLASASACARQAIARSPGHLAPYFTLLHCASLAGRAEEAAGLVEQLIDRLEDRPARPEELQGVLLPRNFDGLTAALERARAERGEGSDGWAEDTAALLLSYLYRRSAETAFRACRFREAATRSAQALECRPALPGAAVLHAMALQALGQIAEACAAYRYTLRETPFDFGARQAFVRLLLDADRAGEAREPLDDWKAILDACPGYAELQPAWQSLQCEMERRLIQTDHSPPVQRLLAFPDWRNPETWQEPVRRFVAAGADTPRLLMLRADPSTAPPLRDLLRNLGLFLTDQLGIQPDRWPDIALLSDPLPPHEEWKLFRVADALLSAGPLQPWQQELVEAQQTPVWEAAPAA